MSTHRRAPSGVKRRVAYRLDLAVLPAELTPAGGAQVVAAEHAHSGIPRAGKRRASRVIGLIHRQETMSFLGFPVARYLDIEDSEAVLRAIQPLHEAVVYQADPAVAEQRIKTVLRPGYRLGTRLVRPAQVVVAGPGANHGRHNDGSSHRH